MIEFRRLFLGRLADQPIEVGLTRTFRQSPNIGSERSSKLLKAALIPLSLALWLFPGVVAAGDLPSQQPILQLAQSESSEPTGNGILSELRLGAMAHDVGAFGRQEEDGINLNVEFMFVSPEFLSAIWSPRPHAGFSVNSSSGTNQAYLGLTWTWEFLGKMFAEASFGGAYHDGETVTNDLKRKSLGCKVLFRESVSLGYNLTEAHNLSLMLDHISSAKLCDPNEGLDTLGLRYGYRF